MNRSCVWKCSGATNVGKCSSPTPNSPQSLTTNELASLASHPKLEFLPETVRCTLLLVCREKGLDRLRPSHYGRFSVSTVGMPAWAYGRVVCYRPARVASGQSAGTASVSKARGRRLLRGLTPTAHEKKRWRSDPWTHLGQDKWNADGFGDRKSVV